MKKSIIVLLLLIGTVVIAQESASFTITVTVNYVDFTLRNAADSAPYGTWGIGNLAAGSEAEMTVGTAGDHIFVDNQSNIALSFKAYSTSAAPTACGFGTATAWAPATTAGTDEYKLEMGKGAVSALPTAYATMDGGDEAGADLVYSTTAGEDFHLYAKLTAPTAVSDGCGHSITVYVLATP